MAVAAWGLALLGLSLLGFLDSLYFFLVTYRVMRPDPRWLPAVCRMDEQSCARIVDTPHGRALGLPNSIYGLAWYGLLGAAAQWAIAFGHLPYCDVLVWLSLAPIAFTVYLAWALLYRLHVVCLLCYAAHAINVLVPFTILGVCGYL